MQQRGKEEAETTKAVRGEWKPATAPIAWALELAGQAPGEAEGLSVMAGETHPCVPGAVTITHIPREEVAAPAVPGGTSSKGPELAVPMCQRIPGAQQHGNANQALAPSSHLLVWQNPRGLSLQK